VFYGALLSLPQGSYATSLVIDFSVEILMYKLVNLGYYQYVLRISDSKVLLNNPANEEFAEYLKWLEKGNTPLPADE